jgi:hypothetical protein
MGRSWSGWCAIAMPPRGNGPAVIRKSAVRVTGALAAAAAISVIGAAGGQSASSAGQVAVRSGSPPPPPGYRELHRNVLINADIWASKPEMMAASLGFTNIIGVPGLSTSDLAFSQTRTVLAGGTWNRLHCAAGETPSLSNYTSAATPAGVRFNYGQYVYYSDGLPVEFSWPILPSTLQPGDFLVTLSNGTTVTPQVSSVYPNYEYNERSVAVLFGHFGNRIPPDQPGAIYPTSVKVVRGSSTLELVGPGRRVVSAVGMSVKSRGSPYTSPDVPPADRGGPVLVAAKLSKMSTLGDNAPPLFRKDLPNNGAALYGARAKFRLRVYTSGGMTPNGVSALLPTDYDTYFRVNAVTPSGAIIRLTKAGRTYDIDGHPLRVVGLADLGKKQARYDDCYSEDGDNYIDIILDGSAAAARRISTVEIPSTGRYKPLYNPGGPGDNPAPGVHYSAASPPISEHVTIALKNPMTVTYLPRHSARR